MMTTPERARDLRKPPVLVAGVGAGHASSGAYWSQQPEFTSTPQVFSAPAAFEMADIGPADVNVLTLYDPFTIVTLMQIEDMGFCEKGAAGGFVEGSDGAQDHDLLLRISERTDAIVHVPRILYHWRQAPTSVSSSSTKPWAFEAGRRAVADHLGRVGVSGEVVDQVRVLLLK